MIEKYLCHVLSPPMNKFVCLHVFMFSSYSSWKQFLCARSWISLMTSMHLLWMSDTDPENVTTWNLQQKNSRKQMLVFNSTGTQHSASECHGCKSYIPCKQRHHSSICDRLTTAWCQTTSNGGEAFPATQGENMCHTVVIIKLNGMTCRALCLRIHLGSIKSCIVKYSNTPSTNYSGQHYQSIESYNMQVTQKETTRSTSVQTG